MLIEKYESFVLGWATYPGRLTFAGLMYTMLALGGEAGEAQNVLKKLIRDDGCDLSEKSRIQLLLELGDVLWYLVATADELGSSIREVIDLNIAKLTQRDEERRPIG